MEPGGGRDASVMDDGRYRLLVDAVTDHALYMLDPEGRVVTWNPGAARITGYAASEILGRHFSRFHTAEDRRAGLPARALAIAADEGRFEGDGWRIRKDGSRFWAHVVIDPIRDPAGSLIGFVESARDRSERRAAEESLRRSEEQFRLLVQGVVDYAIYMLDPEGRITSWNEGARRIKGYRPEEIVGDHFSRFYTEEDRAAGEPRRALEIAAREGRYEKEAWRVRKDGTRFWANVVIDAIRDDAGAVLGFAKITRDITERRAAQEALDLAREALVQSQKMDAIGRLTGGIAHDFNNLLMAVLGGLELVRKRLPDNPRITPLIDNALLAARRGASLTQRMLAFARRQELKPEAIDVPALVGGMTDLLERSLGPAVTVETRFPPGLQAIRADANQLELALLNLAVNARDAMPEGGTIVIAARPEEVAPGSPGGPAPGRYVCLSVTDTGEGMDAATLERAMEPFFTTKGVGKGTGLGLSMVHGLTEQSGGRLVLHSRKGAGTTAELWFPVVDAAAAPAGRDRRPAAPAVAVGRPLVVLVVDDDALVLTNTAAMLEDLGHTALPASSGRDALAALAQGNAVDLVITDEAMPQMTGTQLAEAIGVEWPGLPIILATGYAEPPPGGDPGPPKLAKPFLQEDLARAIAAAMAGEQAAVSRRPGDATS
ncbi:MAG: PAS domain S-box protein, partial [Alphaproteobacteria bacterium]|nr:PAS domain S-box protein [Alphaproteobacteria bacterium]